MSFDLETLKNRWLATRSFADEQAYLRARILSGGIRFIALDPDGTMPPWLVLVVRRETGVIYGTQCAGVGAEQRFAEGYLIPLGGSKYDVDGGAIEVEPFVKVFHVHDACKWNWTGRELLGERLAALARLVEQIPYWHCSLDGHDGREFLRIDMNRIGEIAEGWVPVETKDGPGVLLYQNCD